MATHSSTLAWKFPWTEKPGSHSPWVAELDTTERLHFHFLLSVRILPGFVWWHFSVPWRTLFSPGSFFFFLPCLLLFPAPSFMLRVRVKSEVKSLSRVKTLRPHGLWPTRLLRPWDFPGKRTGVGCHWGLQGIFPTQGSNLGLPHCRQMLCRLKTLLKYLMILYLMFILNLGIEVIVSCWVG